MGDKKLSGAQFRKQKKLAAEAARKNEEARKIAGGEKPARLMLSAPPLGNPTAAIAWAADAVLIALSEIQADTQITAEQRWNLVAKMVNTIGMTHSKAVTQARLQELVESDEPEHDEELEPNPLRRRDPK